MMLSPNTQDRVDDAKQAMENARKELPAGTPMGIAEWLCMGIIHGLLAVTYAINDLVEEDSDA